MSEKEKDEFNRLIKYTEYLAEHIDTLIQFVDSDPSNRRRYDQYIIEKGIHIEKFNPVNLDPQNRLRF